MTRPYDRLRDSIANLGRDDLRKLAAEARCSREALQDFAEIGIAPDREIIDKLEAWHEVHTLRQLLGRHLAAPISDISAATGISLQTLNDFHDGTVDLDAVSMQLVRDFLIGKIGAIAGSIDKDGKLERSGSYIRQAAPAAPAVMQAHQSGFSAELQRRGDLAKEFAALPLAEQERLLAPTRITKVA